MAKHKKGLSKFQSALFFILCIIVMGIMGAFSMSSMVKDIKLAIYHTETQANIVDIVSKGSYKAHWKDITFQYEKDGMNVTGSMTLQDTFFRDIKKYHKGQQITVFIGDDGYSFIKNDLLEDIIINVLLSIFAVAIVFIIIINPAILKSDFNLLYKNSRKKGIFFYVKKNDYKVDVVKNSEIGDMGNYFDNLKNYKTISFGFQIGGRFYEYSYRNGIFYEKIHKGNKNKILQLYDKEKALESAKKHYEELMAKAK
ncbi:MAG: hypothetical protein K6F69_09805 [Treponema sp.]|nr:hypothetical protein [Treponema sp.]